MNEELIQGGLHTDARGVLRFCNDFDMSAVKRFYTIANSAEQPVRGWIGHKKETKWFFPLRGRTVIEVESFGQDLQDGQDFGFRVSSSECRVRINEEDAKGSYERFILNANEPKVLKVPPGNWFKIVQDGNSEVMIFSDCKVGEFENDDFRREL
jgi:dTDP-4-dehydrorhamnose 3,5-epimerase